LPSVDAFRTQVEEEASPGPAHPRWIRVNTLKTTVRDQVETTFAGFETVSSVEDIVNGAKKAICIDSNIPDLVALSPGTDFTKTNAYKSGAIILQDKASCFPAYLLDPSSGDGDVIDSCAAPGNKTTQLAALLGSRTANSGKVFAFEKDKNRGATLERMVKLAGADDVVQISKGQDFLKVKPNSEVYKNVRALLLDPSCSGSGIVGRDEMPDLHLPENTVSGTTGKKKKPAKSPAPAPAPAPASSESRKRKRSDQDHAKPPLVLIDDDGESVAVPSERDLSARIDALSAFQLSLVLHALSFPAAERITYSTCSVHARENEGVVLAALQSDIAKSRGWRILGREAQVKGLREWPVRGDVEACEGDEGLADACIRTYRDDGRGVMGFFVAAFVRDAGEDDEEA